jgi:Mg-chelatase subunit ChlD
LIFTDARANVPLSNETAHGQHARAQIHNELQQLGAALQQTGIASIIIDTQNRFTAGNEGQALAKALGGQYLNLEFEV